MCDDLMFNWGVQYVVDLFVKIFVLFGDWYVGDGFEDYDCDFEEMFCNIFVVKGFYDKEMGEFVSVEQLNMFQWFEGGGLVL